MNDLREYNNICSIVYDVLEYGKKRAKTAEQIGAILDMSKREVEEEVRQERLRGIPICSCQGGYYRGSREDQIATYNYLKSRVMGSLEVIKAFAKAIWEDEEQDNQMTLSDLFDMEV